MTTTTPTPTSTTAPASVAAGRAGAARRATAACIGFVRAEDRSLHRSAVGYAGTIAVLAVLGSALLVDKLESGVAGSNIHGFGDAIWWAITTVSTVGYGDRFPITAGGRVVAAGLIFVGVSLFGILTAATATHFVRHVKQESDDVTGQEMAERLARVERMLKELLAQSARSDQPPA